MGKVAVIRVIAQKDGSFQLEVEKILLEFKEESPILGMFITNNVSQIDPSMDDTILHIVTYNKQMHSFYIGFKSFGSIYAAEFV
jgi:hypothetical protein